MLSFCRFPLLVVEAVPVGEIRLGALGPRSHRVVRLVHDAGGALLAAAIGVFHTAGDEGAFVPFVEVSPVYRQSFAFLERCRPCDRRALISRPVLRSCSVELRTPALGARGFA